VGQASALHSCICNELPIEATEAEKTAITFLCASSDACHLEGAATFTNDSMCHKFVDLFCKLMNRSEDDCAGISFAAAHDFIQKTFSDAEKAKIHSRIAAKHKKAKQAEKAAEKAAADAAKHLAEAEEKERATMATEEPTRTAHTQEAHHAEEETKGYVPATMEGEHDVQ
jgi:hypothetical protein